MFSKSVLLAGLFSVAICSTTYAQEKFVADKVVAVVGGSAILYSEVLEMGDVILAERQSQNFTLDRDPKSEALEELMTQKLLCNQAQIDSVEINLNDVIMSIENYVQGEINKFGSISAVEKFYGKPIYEIREETKAYYEEVRYASAMRGEIESKVKITPGEVERFFNKIDKDSLPIIPEQYVYAHITKNPGSAQEAKQRTRESLLEMRERIMNGTKFSTLARMYSVDPGSALKGGEMDPQPAKNFEKPFGDALTQLKPGQVSEVVETIYGLHIIKLIDKKGELYHFKHILLKPVFTDAEVSATSKTLDSIMHLVKVDSISFEAAAAKFSDDKYSKNNGGIASNQDILEAQNRLNSTLTTTKFLKEELTPTDYAALKRLKEGEISSAYPTQNIKGDVMSKVVMLKEIIPSHKASLTEDYVRLEAMALKDKREKIFLEWLNKKIATTYIRVEPEFKNNDFNNNNWLK